MSDPGPNDALAEVAVHAAVLAATADLLDLLSAFFTGTDQATRIRLGCYLVDRYGPENTTDSVTEAAVMLGELTDAAELLHALALAGDYHPDNVATLTSRHVGQQRDRSAKAP